MEKEIVKIIDEIRPYLMNDGGNIEFVKVEDDIVYVKLQGACAGCPMREMTVKNGIENIIIEKLPNIKEVSIIEED